MSKYFEFKINLSHVLSLLAMLGTFMGVWRAMEMSAVETRKDVEYLKQEQKTQNEIINDSLTKLEAITIAQAKITERLEWLQKSSVRVAPGTP